MFALILNPYRDIIHCWKLRLRFTMIPRRLRFNLKSWRLETASNAWRLPAHVLWLASLYTILTVRPLCLGRCWKIMALGRCAAGLKNMRLLELAQLILVSLDLTVLFTWWFVHGKPAVLGSDMLFLAVFLKPVILSAVL